MYLVTKWFGTFLCDEKGIQNKILFENNEKEISKILYSIEKKEILPEEKKIIGKKTVVVNEKRLISIGEYNPSDNFFKKIEIKSEDFGFSEKILHKASLIFAKKKVDEKLSSEDLQIIQMVNTLDDLLQTSNLLSERLERWSVLPDHDEKNLPLKNTLTVVNNEIKNIEKQIDEDMEKIAPNITLIIGPLIGARLLSYAGGLEKLAMLPASTIQILGAEKALFRFKKEGGKPPKHGVIFQNSLINKSPKEYRGRIARLISTKLAIAAKADAFTKRDISKNLKDDLEKKIREFRKN